MVAILDHAHFLAHTPFANHPACDCRCHLNVAACAIGDVAKDNFLRNAAAHADSKTSEQLLFAVGIFVFLWQPPCRPKRWTRWTDGDFVQRLSVREKLQ